MTKKNFSQLKGNLNKDFLNFNGINVALLGDSSTQFLNQALRGTAFDRTLNMNIWEADFNQIELQIFNPFSGLFNYNPEIIIIYHSTQKLIGHYNKLNPSEYKSLADSRIELIKKLCTAINNKIQPQIIYYNYPEINDFVFGNYANKLESSFLFQIRKLNYELMNYAITQSNFHICDLSSVQNQFGKNLMFDSNIYVNSDIVLSLDILPEVASKTLDLIDAIKGKTKKCLILDLDNTIWGGIIGEDGPEHIQIGNLGIGKAFSELQEWIIKLKNRGIIIAVCSKNTESLAKVPFEKNSEMILRLEDISVFISNWDNKVDNIIKIRNILQIGFDSMVFLDDSPYERALVRNSIPQITVPELPIDPADYLDVIYLLNLFETVNLSNEDLDRTKYYQNEITRNSDKLKFFNEDDFLASLNMYSKVEPFNKFNVPRVVQLSQRSNQFNLRSSRYSEIDIERISSALDYFTFSFNLKDNFGDYGQIAVVILKKNSDSIVFIEAWFMSCRILKRGMDNFILNTIVDFIKKRNFKTLKGEYVETPKNTMVKDHYLNLGFIKKNGLWELNLNNYTAKKNFINFIGQP